MTIEASIINTLNFFQEVIDDITDTTIYVVAVIAIIPIAGLFAWFARATLRRKVRL